MTQYGGLARNIWAPGVAAVWLVRTAVPPLASNAVVRIARTRPFLPDSEQVRALRVSQRFVLNLFTE